MNKKYKVSIGLSRPNKWKILAWLIMLIEGTKYSHVFVTWKCEAIQRRKIFEAVGSGIRILSNVNFKKHAKVIELYDFYVDKKTLIEIERDAHDMSGRPYGIKALFGLAWMRLVNCFYRIIKRSKKTTNPFKDGDYSQVCIEAGGMVLNRIEKLVKNYEDMGLKDFKHILLSHCDDHANQARLDRINKN
jgi:hypothetical protein